MILGTVFVADVTGEDLRIARRTLGLSQSAFAGLLGLSPVYLATLERGGRGQTVTPRIVRRLLDVTGGEKWDEAIHRIYETDNLLAEIREAVEQDEFDRYTPEDEGPAPDLVQSDIG